MTEKPNVEVQRVIHSVLSRGDKEKPARKGVLSMSEGARQVTGAILGLHSKDVDENNEAKAFLDNLLPVKKSGEKYSSFEELNDDVRRLRENCPRELKARRNDITMGFAVATQIIVDDEIADFQGDLEKRKVGKALVTNNFREVENLMLEGFAPRLKGLAGVIEKGGNSLVIITTPGLAEVVNKLQDFVTEGGRFNARNKDSLEALVEEMYKNEANALRPGEVMLVQNYLAWAMEDVGNEPEIVQTPTKPEASNLDPSVAALVNAVQLLTNALQNNTNPAGGTGGLTAEQMAMMARQTTGGKDGDGQSQAQLAMMQEMMKFNLNELSEGAVKEWVINLMDSLSRNSLFFAGSWQQLIGHIDTQMVSLYENNRGAVEPAEFEKIRKVAEGFAAVRIQEAAIRHSDSTLETYYNMIPPADSMDRYIWNKELRETLEADMLTDDIHQWMMARAYDDTNGGVGAKWIRDNLSKQKIESLASVYAAAILKNTGLMERYRNQYGDSLTPQMIEKHARMAVSWFIVDDYINWAAWINQCASENSFGQNGWINRNDLLMQVRAKAGDANSEVQVEVWNSNLMSATGQTDIDHPLFTMVKPVDLLRVKRAYGEDVLQPVEKGLILLATEKWRQKRDKNKPERIIESDLPFPRLSDINPKDILRYAKAWTAFIGNPYGDMLESMDKLEGGAEQVRSMFNDEFGKNMIAGAVVGDVWAGKIEAMLTGTSEGFFQNMARTIALAQGFTKEQSVQIQTILGSDLTGQYGMLRAQMKRLNLNLNTVAFTKALRKIQTSVKDEKYLGLAVKVKGGMLFFNVIQDVLEALGSMDSGKSLKRK